jgi:hypothetical protein
MLEPPDHGRLTMNVRLSLNVRLSFPQQAFLALAALGQVVACASKVVMPPAYGDCMEIGDASCAAPVSGGGVSEHMEASTSSDLDTGAPLSDSGICGVGPLSLTPGNSTCLPCITTSGPTGCCQATSVCSTDPECVARVMCAATQTIATCGTPQNVNAAQLLMCLEMYCPSACSEVILGFSSEQ